MSSNYDDFSEYSEYIDSSSNLEEENDYFELLSAYIDGEATVEERKQVQHWLDNDPEIKQTYLQLVKLQGEMQNLSAPKLISEKTLSEKVFNEIDRRDSRKRIAIWGSAIAATIIGTVVSIVPNSSFSGLRMAENSSPRNINKSTMVAVSLNKPAVIIPKAVVSTSNE